MPELKYPGEKSDIKAVWDTCEQLHDSNEKIAFAVIKEKIPDEADLADSTIRTQIQRWRQYRGLVTPRPRTKKDETQAQPEAETQAQPEAEVPTEAKAAVA